MAHHHVFQMEILALGPGTNMAAFVTCSHVWLVLQPQLLFQLPLLLQSQLLYQFLSLVQEPNLALASLHDWTSHPAQASDLTPELVPYSAPDLASGIPLDLIPSLALYSDSCLRPCSALVMVGPLHVVGDVVTVKPIVVNDRYINPELGKYHARLRTLSRSCQDIKEKFGATTDGIYYLTTANGVMYQSFCDMTTAGGGWTLVASVHENNIHGKCTLGDRWSSQQGSDPKRPDGEGTWANTITFGSAEGATSDDYKNPGYYDILAEDVSVWHVPNGAQLQNWTSDSILRYHTETKFLSNSGGNLYYLFKKYPVRFGIGECSKDTGPTSPVVYDTGDKHSTKTLYGPSVRDQFEPGFITFRVFNEEKAAMAICSGIKPIRCHTEHYCIGGGGHFPEKAPQCGDFTGFDSDSYGSNTGKRASKELTEAAVLIFYR
ncbi:intelectin-like [Electrophorus electricus]|uniref:intelectin-like n=1 Tax=Electrophorus electricus TaxID=8005 RepID=UPI0015D0B088|nr:intelectin-like [Electrophorus electricus]